MADIGHENFDLCIDRDGEGYRARVAAGPVGEAAAAVAWDLTEEQIESFLFRIGRPRRRTRRAADPLLDEARAFGSRLFAAVFRGDVRANLERSMAAADARGAGLRIRLRLGNAPDLADLPWEFLCPGPSGQFLCLSSNTPVVRYLDLGDPVRPLRTAPPLKVLAAISSPSDHPRLDTEREWGRLAEALDPLVKRGLVRLDRLGTPSLRALNRRLSDEPFHVLHFVGHGEFDEGTQSGGLVFEDERGRGVYEPAAKVAPVVGDQRSLRLVVLNSCEGARASRTDPFAGTAQALVRQGVPAVVAMQFEITDDAAIALAEDFYRSLAVGRPIDASLSDARRAVFAEGRGIEWATPVLYLRAPEGRVFDVERTGAVEEQLASVESGRAARAAAGRAASPEAERAAARQRSEPGERARAEADTRERAEQDRAEEAERQKGEAEEARLRAEREEARKWAEEQRRRRDQHAEQEAARGLAARREAEAEARRRAEEDRRRRAEEDARWRAEEERRRRAEEEDARRWEARRRAEEEKRRRADEEEARRWDARRQDEEKARRRAEQEDARRWAEEQRRQARHEQRQGSLKGSGKTIGGRLKTSFKLVLVLVGVVMIASFLGLR